MSLNSAGLREEFRMDDEEPSGTSAEVSLGVSADPLAEIRTEASGRFARELHDVRAALTASYDQGMERLADNQWLPLDLVTRLVNKLSRETAAERERATDLAQALDVAKGEVETVRAECQTVINATQAAAAQERKETAARFAQELNAARDAARSAATAEVHVRTELLAVRKRCQEIVDSQMLQLIEFKRELEQGTPKTDRAGTAADAAPRDTNTRPTQADAPVGTVDLRAERSKTGAPTFAAIEAALADSPPLGKWPARAAV